jgi:hypothetical protein
VRTFGGKGARGIRTRSQSKCANSPTVPPSGENIPCRCVS